MREIHGVLIGCATIALGFALVASTAGPVSAQTPGPSPSVTLTPTAPPTVLGQQQAPTTTQMTPAQTAFLSQLGLTSLPAGAQFGSDADGNTTLIFDNGTILTTSSVAAPGTTDTTTGAQTGTDARTTTGAQAGTDAQTMTGTQAGTQMGARTATTGVAGLQQLPSTSTK